MTFEEVWEKEEREGLLQRLRQDYPVWQRQRRIRRTVLTTVAVLAATGISLTILLSPLSTRQYDAVACNRTGITDAHWAEVASHILTAQTL